MTVLATAAKDAADGARPVTVGEAKLADGLAVFHKIDKLVVEPAYTIARTGGDGGPIAKLPAQFEAVAYAGGLRLGVVAAKWSTAPFDAIAAAVTRLRRHTTLPVAVGFGLKTAAQVAVVGGLADAAVVGSAIVERLAAGLDAEGRVGPGLVAGVHALVRDLAAGLKSKVRP